MAGWQFSNQPRSAQWERTSKVVAAVGGLEGDDVKMSMHDEGFELNRAESGSPEPKAPSGLSGPRVENREASIPSWRTIIWCMLTNPLLRVHSAWLRLEIGWLRRRLRRRGIDPDSIPGIKELRRREEEAKRGKGEAKSQGP